MEKEQEIRELTRAELQVMQLLWSREHAFVNDLIDLIPEPKPAYNTISTIVRILEKKGFVGHRAYGKTHEYHPLISREEYTSRFMHTVLNNFFDNSLVQMVSFFSQREKISMADMDEIMRILAESPGADKPGGDRAQLSDPVKK